MWALISLTFAKVLQSLWLQAVLSNQIGTPGTKIVEGCNCWFYQFDNVHQLVSRMYDNSSGSCDPLM